ncbi:MAG: hypothetical protein WCH74_14915, partial [Chloroflexota bacterium]
MTTPRLPRIAWAVIRLAPARLPVTRRAAIRLVAASALVVALGGMPLGSPPGSLAPSTAYAAATCTGWS